MSKLSKDNKGLSQSVLILIIVIAAAVIGVIIWQVTKKSTPSSTTNTASVALVSATCLKTFNDNKLCAFAEHTKLSSMQYEAAGTVTVASGTTYTFTDKHDGSDNKDLSYTSGTKEISIITLGGIVYYQDGAGTTWYEYASGNAPSSLTDPTAGFNLNFSVASRAGLTVIKEGTATCGSLSCYEYRVTDTTDPGGIGYIYFDTSSYLLRKWTSTNSVTGTSTNMTFTYPSVTITKPSPVQIVTT